jgi:nucleoside-diphosphate-sugar epimerase
MRIALTGASGFLGTRLLEVWGLTQRFDFVPIIRSYGSAAPVGRIGLPFEVADATDHSALTSAFKGCDAIVHAALGDPAQIVAMAEAVCSGAERNGIKRIINLSSAVALGMVPPEGSGDLTPGLSYKPLDYCSGKGVAEAIFARHGSRSGCQVIQLRPFTIYGPRSRLVGRILDSIAGKRAWLLNGGAGVCNAVYVDNVIHAVECGLLAGREVEGVFHINDSAELSWRDFYSALSAEANFPDAAWPEPWGKPASPQAPKLPDRVKSVTSKELPQKIFKHVPERAKRIVKGMIAGWPTPIEPNPRALPNSLQAPVDPELYDLQSGIWRFDCRRAHERLGYDPPVTFNEGIRRTVAWYRVFG